MTGITARFALDLIEPGQAQKELFHNEALARIDLGLHAAVIAAGMNEPPVDPEAGGCWIIGDAPAGAWTGHARALAGWTAGGWRFLEAREGMAVWDAGRRVALRFTAGSWEAGIARVAELRVEGRRVVGPQAPAIAEPAAGATMDAEARVAIVAVLAALRTHGLIAG